MRILFILLMFSFSAEAQTLFKVVNGVSVPFTSEDYTQYRIDSTNYKIQFKADSVEKVKQAQIKSSILTTAQSAVGVSITALTAAQVRSLVAILFFKEGAIDSALKIKPLNTWVK